MCETEHCKLVKTVKLSKLASHRQINHVINLKQHTTYADKMTMKSSQFQGSRK